MREDFQQLHGDLLTAAFPFLSGTWKHLDLPSVLLLLAVLSAVSPFETKVSVNGPIEGGCILTFNSHFTW